MTETPLYTTLDSVKVRLTGKVQFQSGETLLDGELPIQLLNQQVFDAESAVELALRVRYKIPFQSIRTGQYFDLPDHTKRQIRRLVDMKAVMLILKTDFGSGTHVDASKYYEEIEKEYKSLIDEVLGRDAEGANDKIDRFRHSPPLDDLALARVNQLADNGYRGMLINTDASRDGAEGYAARQINDPSKTWLRRRGDRGP